MDEGQRTFEERFEAFLMENHLVRPGSAIVLAVSGGMDSMVMLHLFSGLRASWNLRLSVVHVNHQLRDAESDEDEQFVRLAAEEAKIPFVSIRIDVKSFQAERRLSKQEAARELRYEAFEKARMNGKADAVATAHHADDNAETVLMNALRGAGIRGLSGIPLRREQGSVVRPLLWASRNDIKGYAVSKGIRYREDSSNASTAYTRNLLRNVVLPRMENLTQGNVVESLNRVSSIMRSLQESIAAEVQARMPSLATHEGDRLALGIEALRAEPLYLQEEIMLEVFRNLDIEPSTKKVQSCLNLCLRPTGRLLQLGSGWNLYHDRGKLVFAREEMREAFEYEIEMGRQYTFDRFRFGSTPVSKIPDYREHRTTTEYADADKIGSHLVLRNWRPGDWFVPLGMDRKKKLSDFFVNEKVSLWTKQSTPILESGGAVVWVCGLRLDQRFRITSSTRHVVKLNYSPSIPQ